MNPLLVSSNCARSKGKKLGGDVRARRVGERTPGLWPARAHEVADQFIDYLVATDMCRESNQPVRCCVATVRWTPIIIVVAVLCWAYYAYVFELCINSVESEDQRVIYLVVSHTLLILFLWSYYQGVFTEVAQPPSAYFLDRETLEDLDASSGDERRRNEILQRFITQNRLPVHTRLYDGSIRYCSKCKCVKPDRAYHCSVCSKCVLMFDHHCPWLNTCVNFNNYKFFLLFLGWGVLLCLWGFVTDAAYFVDFWQKGSQYRLGDLHLLILFFLSGMFGLSIAYLFIEHLILTARNRSTFESFRPPIFAHGRDKHAFDLGCALNYQQVFGSRYVLWPLPIFTALGDGVRFDQRRSWRPEEDNLMGGDELRGDDRAERRSLLPEALDNKDELDEDAEDALLSVHFSRPPEFIV